MDDDIGVYEGIKQNKARTILQYLREAWASIIEGYFSLGRVEDAEKIYNDCTNEDVLINNTMLLGGHVKNGNLNEALKLFNHMPKCNVVSWNTILQGTELNLISTMKINELRLVFDVNPLNINFRKTRPGNQLFIPCRLPTDTVSLDSCMGIWFHEEVSELVELRSMAVRCRTDVAERIVKHRNVITQMGRMTGFVPTSGCVNTSVDFGVMLLRVAFCGKGGLVELWYNMVDVR
ncbi:pentatricopeptide repeat-containing protein [Tanacetum coccineum]